MAPSCCLKACSCSSSTMTRPSSRERQEQRRPRPHHHPRLAVHHGAIDPAAFLLRTVAVPFRRPHPEAPREAFQELHRQRDLRQQDQDLLAGRDRRRHGFEIDLGLAAAGDAIQQMRGKSVRRHRRRAAPAPPRCLVAVQLRRGEIRHPAAGTARIPAARSAPARPAGSARAPRRSRHWRLPPARRRCAPARRPRSPAPACAPRSCAAASRCRAHRRCAARFRLEGAAAAQRHRQDRARRVQGVIRHPVDEVAQFSRQRAARLPAVRPASAGCRRPCLRPRPTPRPASRGSPAVRQPGCRAARYNRRAACSHRPPPAAAAATRPPPVFPEFQGVARGSNGPGSWATLRPASSPGQ